MYSQERGGLCVYICRLRVLSPASPSLSFSGVLVLFRLRIIDQRNVDRVRDIVTGPNKHSVDEGVVESLWELVCTLFMTKG